MAELVPRVERCISVLSLLQHKARSWDTTSLSSLSEADIELEEMMTDDKLMELKLSVVLT